MILRRWVGCIMLGAPLFVLAVVAWDAMFRDLLTISLYEWRRIVPMVLSVLAYVGAALWLLAGGRRE